MLTPAPRRTRRFPFPRWIATPLGVASLATVGLAAPLLLAPLDLTGWTQFDPSNNWSVSFPTPTSLRMTEKISSPSVHPGWVVSDLVLGAEATIEFDLSVSASTGDDDFIGFGFSYLDGSHSWLMDWKKSTQTFNWHQPVVIDDDVAEQGIKLKRIDGAYTWDGLWGGQDGLGVSTIAGPTGGQWVAGTVYHFVFDLAPGHIVVTRNGASLFDVVDPAYPGAAGSIACYGFSQTNINLANIVVTSATWSGLGHGKPGPAGLPVLSGSGELVAGSANQLSLTNAASSKPATLVFGLSELDAPFKGGTMVPQPLLLVQLVSSPAGEVLLPFIWPNGVPADLALYFQFWIQDPGASFGLSASNGLKGVSH